MLANQETPPRLSCGHKAAAGHLGLSRELNKEAFYSTDAAIARLGCCESWARNKKCEICYRRTRYHPDNRHDGISRHFQDLDRALDGEMQQGRGPDRAAAKFEQVCKRKRH